MDKEISLYDRLSAYSRSDYAAFHMPGHKRQVKAASLPEGLPWEIDITEIEGFDNLHHAEGILKESMDRAAALYGSRRALFSVGGSTAGILASVFAVTRPGDLVLMGRNCHKSVYHAVLLRQLRPLYIYPETEEKTGIALGYDPAQLEEILEKNPGIRAVILTSPTYEGVVSDIRKITEILHQRGIPLIVDEAHGAHFSGRNRPWDFPVSAVDQGADIVIQSLHKTLPSLTQTGLVHLCGSLAEEGELSRYMDIFQTSSPSYILMASIDSCIRFLSCEEGREKMQAFSDRVKRLRLRLGQYQKIRLLDLPGAEPSKLVVTAEGMNGRSLYAFFLERYHIQAEMCAGSYVLLMTAAFDTDEMYERLCLAFAETEKILQEKAEKAEKTEKAENTENTAAIVTAVSPIPPRQIFTPAQADGMEMEEIAICDSAGRVSGEYAYQYPPGIPLLVPGEEIHEGTLKVLLDGREQGLEIQGLKRTDGSRIQVIR